MITLHQNHKLRFMITVLLTLILFVSFHMIPVAGTSSEQKIILVRMEDIGPGGQYESLEQLGKLRTVLEYLNESGAKVELAVIPRWINIHSDGTVYDRSLDQTDDPYISAFNRLLQDAIHNGNVVGLHGYTHQVGNVRRDDGHHESGIGDEFKVLDVAETSSISFAEQRIQEGVRIFQKIGFRPLFWEAPHYRTTPEQDKVFRSYFGLNFQGNVNVMPDPGKVQYVTERNTGHGTPSLGSIYVPTPFSYIPYNRDANLIINQLDKSDRLPAFFYHPFLEFQHLIAVFDDNGEAVVRDGLPVYQYPAKEKSNLQKLLPQLYEKGYQFVAITDYVPFIPSHSVEVSAQRNIPTAIGDVSGSHMGDIVKWESDGSIYVKRVDYGRLRNDAQEDFKRWASVPYRKGDQMALLDHNNDGLKDLCVVRGEGSFDIYYSDGNKFVQHRSWPIPTEGWSEIYVMRHSVNGWIIAGQKADRSQLEGFYLKHNQLHKINPKVWAKKSPASLFVGDLDGNNKETLFYANKQANRFYELSLNLNTMSWNTHLVKMDVPRGYSGEPRFGDFNGDGKQDIVYWDEEQMNMTVLRQMDNGRFEFMSAMGPWGKKNAQVIVYDLDGNGRQDIVLNGKEDPYLDTALSFQSR